MGGKATNLSNFGSSVFTECCKATTREPYINSVN